jgi:cell division protein FtsN
MTNFPADVVKAEQLTGGNSNILSSLEIPTKSTPTARTSSSSNAAAAAAVVASPDAAKKTVQQASSPPVASAAKKSGSYNSSVKVQNTTSTVQKPNDKPKLTCTMCNFSTDRMNLLMMHIKNHSLSILSRVNCKS